MDASPDFDYAGRLDSGLDYTSNRNRVTVDSGYLNALVRRTQLVRSSHASLFAAKVPLDTDTIYKHDSSRPIDHASITVARTEYDSLLRNARDYEALRKALMMGGVESNTLDILVANTHGIDARKDSALDFDLSTSKAVHAARPSASTPWRQVDYETVASNDAPEYDVVEQNASHGPLAGNMAAMSNVNGLSNQASLRTLYFSGLSNRTTYKDLFSVLKGGKIASVVLRHESAVVCFVDGAANFLAWSKRNDVYLQGKRVEVKWAEHEFKFHSHIADKVAGGATRNLMIYNALRGGLSEHRIREDMEHISNLVIIDVKYRGGNAYVYTNAINYALFARTCMMSRAEYKGHKIEFFRDECDVPLPLREIKSFAPHTHSAPKKAKKASISNRFDVLNVDGTEAGSDEDVENRDPEENGDFSDSDSTPGFPSGFGARLNFLDSDE
ncbi:hypothetical protein Q7P37_005179 [Cladosporium fusiforme]